MKWINTNADEHLLVDDAGRRTEYRIKRDPVTGVHTAYDGTRKIREHLALMGLLRECEERYAAERGFSKSESGRKSVMRNGNNKGPATKRGKQPRCG